MRLNAPQYKDISGTYRGHIRDILSVCSAVRAHAPPCSRKDTVILHHRVCSVCGRQLDSGKDKLALHHVTYTPRTALPKAVCAKSTVTPSAHSLRRKHAWALRCLEARVVRISLLGPSCRGCARDARARDARARDARARDILIITPGSTL